MVREKQTWETKMNSHDKSISVISASLALDEQLYRNIQLPPESIILTLISIPLIFNLS